VIRRRIIVVRHVFEKPPLPVETRVVYIEPVMRTTAKVKANSHIACRAHAVPLPCLTAKGSECVFSI